MARKLRVLHAAGEAVPLAKTGGLADVVGSLPRALVENNTDARIVIPGYKVALEAAKKLGRVKVHPQQMHIEAGGHVHQVGVAEIILNKVRYYMLVCPELYERDGLYGPVPNEDYDDNARRYSVFAKAVLALPTFIKWVPHIIHAHDWQAGLIPPLLERGFGNDLPATRCVFSIHNIAYQGTMWHFDMKLAGLDWALFNHMQLEHNGQFNYLKAGVVFADRVTTVSRRYADEILTPEFGAGLEEVLQHHHYKVSGIHNGIDTQVWDPENDPEIAMPFSAKDLSGKKDCALALRKELGLVTDTKACLVGVISRLVEQKGLDLVLETVEPYVLSGRMQLVVLGSGDPVLEHGFHQLAASHPGWVTFWRGYNEGLSHRIEAGSDIFLMPSRFEPCGLNQMYSMRYGTLPIVRYTGGLADTVTDVLVDNGTGFTFGPADVGYFSSAIDRALGLFEHYPKEWAAAQVRAMAVDNSWQHVSQEYEELYRELVFL